MPASMRQSSSCRSSARRMARMLAAGSVIRIESPRGWGARSGSSGARSWNRFAHRGAARIYGAGIEIQARCALG